ncbi:MAG TPA: glycosyltransferase family 2 protein [Ignavibacteriaceae bacterium]|nr:glycosyltransferase family 2 protein [Ignavibacteriaceae bacterium]
MEDKNLSEESAAGSDEKINSQEKPREQSSDYRSHNKKHYYNKRRRYFPRSKPGFAEGQTFRKISLVIPLFNEEESINPLSHEIRKALKPLNINYEVLFVDDGSTDNSLFAVKEVCRQDRRFKYISFRKNYGKSAALHVGFMNIDGDLVVTMDADLQDDPAEIPNLIRKIEEGYDLVSGWKKKRYDPFIKKISSRFFNLVTRIFSGIKIHDFNCGLKVYRKEVTNDLKVYGELHRYLPVLAYWQGFKVGEVVVVHHPRRYGTTKFGTSRFFKGFVDLITVTFATRYIKRPMHFFGFFGAFAFLLGLIVNGYLTYLWISGHYLSNRPMLFLGILLIIVGVQFFSVGLLGEMFVHSFQDEKEYIIKDRG